jgi:hypothetical protein
MRAKEKCWSIKEQRPITFTIEDERDGDVMLEFAPMQMTYDTYDDIITSTNAVGFSQYSYIDGSCRIMIDKDCIDFIKNMLK